MASDKHRAGALYTETAHPSRAIPEIALPSDAVERGTYALGHIAHAAYRAALDSVAARPDAPGIADPTPRGLPIAWTRRLTSVSPTVPYSIATHREAVARPVNERDRMRRITLTRALLGSVAPHRAESIILALASMSTVHDLSPGLGWDTFDASSSPGSIDADADADATDVDDQIGQRF